MTLRLSLAVVLVVAAAAARAQGYAEPPPSPPVQAAPSRAATVEPPTATPSTSTIPATETLAPTPTPSTSTSAPAPTLSASPAPPPPAAPPPPDYEPYSPSQITWGPTPRGPSAAEPSGASSTALALEWGLGAIATEGGGMLELGLLGDLGRFAVGGLFTAGGVNEHLGLGLHLAGGPRFPLSEHTRLDGLLDLGLVLFGHDGNDSNLGGHTDTSGSDEVLPSAGARLGFTFTSATSDWYLSVGAAIRHVQRRTVDYTVTDCRILSACVTSPARATYGGTIAGGYLTFGQARRRGR
jgi:hypothetical protein